MPAYERFKMLDVFFGAYLHQDWMYEFENPHEAYETLLALMEPADLARMIDEFSTVLSMDDQQLRSTMRELSHYLDVEHELGWNEREWLRTLRSRASAELQGKSGAGSP